MASQTETFQSLALAEKDVKPLSGTRVPKSVVICENQASHLEFCGFWFDVERQGES